jgi:hypothetical protein
MTLLCILFLLFTSTFAQRFTVRSTGNRWAVEPGSGGIADAIYVPSMNQTGWDVLSISTDASQPALTQAFAAGYIEGSVTTKSIWNAWRAFIVQVPSDPKLTTFATQQDTWLRGQVTLYASTSPYWANVGLILAQFDGLVKGYADSAPAEEQLSYTDQLYWQLQNELGDIENFLQLQDGRITEQDLKPNMESHCSVLIKVSKDGQNLYASHDTWAGYSSMLRTYKYYKLNYNVPGFNSPTIAFTSYPGCLQSTDDFYLTSQQLFVAETTNDVFNSTLYLDYINIQTVPEWMRIILANRMATSGSEWVDTYKQFNSGTYNNQWQIVDYKLFTPGQPIKPGTLWIAEQIPGYIVANDESSYLINQGFWPSYNIPYFDFIYNISGYPAMFDKYGNEYSYSMCARAQIFRRDAPNVQTMDDMKKIMRYNQYQTDPLSLHDACKQISARCDLNTPWSGETLNGWSAFGGIDSKMTDNTMIKTQSAWAVSGPTWDNQPPFAWTPTWANRPNFGMPKVYDFTFQVMTPSF